MVEAAASSGPGIPATSVAAAGRGRSPTSVEAGAWCGRGRPSMPVAEWALATGARQSVSVPAAGLLGLPGAAAVSWEAVDAREPAGPLLTVSNSCPSCDTCA